MKVKLLQLLEPVVESLGYELLTVELLNGNQGLLLRLYIDIDKGITVDDCEIVSRQVSSVLDVEDPIKGHFTLEVSSPGVDRPLVKPEHFERVVGERINVRTRAYILGRRHFVGQLEVVEEKGICVDVDGESYAIPFADIEAAKLKPEVDFRSSIYE